MRELHWHPNTDEWQYYIEGQGRMGVFASSGQARTFDFQAGDVGFVPFAMGHYIENTGDTTLRFLEIFKSSYYADVSLNQWLALTPPELLQAPFETRSASDERIAEGEAPDRAVLIRHSGAPPPARTRNPAPGTARHSGFVVAGDAPE